MKTTNTKQDAMRDLAIALGLHLHTQQQEIRRAKAKGWHHFESHMWWEFEARRSTRDEAARALKAAYHAARALGCAAEFIAGARWIVGAGERKAAA